MKEKINIICLILITLSVIVFSLTYTLRILIDYGCSSPKLYSMPESGTGLEKFGARTFLGVKCIFWEKLLQFQQNF
ncbi:hypothetical protein AMJ49_04565 [Parcubacteria bacterium DG_74_2]|nr:MAG: hypothetical protein AMJ49_04565 [Parcubacteria bacterium DG_74_2]